MHINFNFDLKTHVYTHMTYEIDGTISRQNMILIYIKYSPGTENDSQVSTLITWTAISYYMQF